MGNSCLFLVCINQARVVFEDLRLQGVMLVVLSAVCIGTRCILQDIMASMVLSAVNHVSIVTIVVLVQ